MAATATSASTRPRGRPSGEGFGMWTQEEHERFLEAMRQYPMGPWKHIARIVGTRNTRQTMTHAQKYRQKQLRHVRGLRKPGRNGRRKLEQQQQQQQQEMAMKEKNVVDSPTETSFTRLLDLEPIPLSHASAWNVSLNVSSKSLDMDDGELQWVGECFDALADVSASVDPTAAPMMPMHDMNVVMPVPTEFEWIEHCTRCTV